MREKEIHCKLIKVSIYQKDIIISKIYSTNKWNLKIYEAKIDDFKRSNVSRLIVGYLITSL